MFPLFSHHDRLVFLISADIIAWFIPTTLCDLQGSVYIDEARSGLLMMHTEKPTIGG
jgi:hypothetical protein